MEMTNVSQNLYHFFAKSGQMFSTPAKVNVVAWITTFFSIRIVWGTYQTFLVFRDLWTMTVTPFSPQSLGNTEWTAVLRLQDAGLSPCRLPPWVLAWTLFCGSAQAILNHLWFYSIVRAMLANAKKERQAKVDGVGIDPFSDPLMGDHKKNE